MSHILKTVRVKTDAKDNPQGFYEVNEADFDAKIHTPYQPQPAPAPAEAKKAEKK
jgi:hypothetical protein